MAFANTYNCCCFCYMNIRRSPEASGDVSGSVVLIGFQLYHFSMLIIIMCIVINAIIISVMYTRVHGYFPPQASWMSSGITSCGAQHGD